MGKFKALQEKHKKEIKQLRERCKHEVATDWIMEFWAPGHTTGDEIRVCVECGKQIERRTMT